MVLYRTGSQRDMKEKREKIRPIVDFLEYKIRSGEVSNENGHKIFDIALKNTDLVDDIMYILEMDLPEAETMKRVERLV